DMVWKLSIEAGLIVLLNRLFKQIGKDYKTVYSITGQVLDAALYAPELVGILRTGYRKGGKTAGKELRAKVNVVYPEKNEPEVTNKIDFNLANFAEKEPVERSNFITQTTNEKLNKWTLQTIIGSALAGVTATNEQIADKVSKKFVKQSGARSKQIAITETLNSVEGARLIEANTLIEEGAEVKPEVKPEDTAPKSLLGALIRMWQSRKDDRVRPTHVKADGQTVKGTTEPFTVGDSLLMYPGDTSLGADMAEIIGCRCFAATFIS
ncbi:unnamed protein product, partial [marine sediment metagenome]